VYRKLKVGICEADHFLGWAENQKATANRRLLMTQVRSGHSLRAMAARSFCEV
jgi:hypothetical protein